MVRAGDGALAFLNDGGLHNQLGFGAVAGDLVWNQQARFRVRVGPLNWERFNQFLPGGPALAELSALARHFVNQTMEFEVQLVLRAEEVPWCWVSTETDSPRLGLSSWLKTEEFRQRCRRSGDDRFRQPPGTPPMRLGR